MFNSLLIKKIIVSSGAALAVAASVFFIFKEDIFSERIFSTLIVKSKDVSTVSKDELFINNKNNYICQYGQKTIDKYCDIKEINMESSSNFITFKQIFNSNKLPSKDNLSKDNNFYKITVSSKTLKSISWDKEENIEILSKNKGIFGSLIILAGYDHKYSYGKTNIFHTTLITMLPDKLSSSFDTPKDYRCAYNNKPKDNELKDCSFYDFETFVDEGKEKRKFMTSRPTSKSTQFVKNKKYVMEYTDNKKRIWITSLLRDIYVFPVNKPNKTINKNEYMHFKFGIPMILSDKEWKNSKAFILIKN